MKIDGDQKLITVFMSKIERAERWLLVWVFPSPSSATSSKRDSQGMAFTLISRTDGPVSSVLSTVHRRTNGTSLELKNIFMIAVLLLSPTETLRAPKSRTLHSQEGNKNNIPGEKKERKRRGAGETIQTQVPLFQMAATAIPQRAHTNFGWGHVQHL